MEIQVDGKGNFYTTETIDFGEGLYTLAEGNTNTEHMNSKITSGQCNSCHGISTDRIWIKQQGHNNRRILLKQRQQQLCQAFPIDLVLTDEKKEDGDLIMKTRLSEATFTGEIQDRLENFIAPIHVVS